MGDTTSRLALYLSGGGSTGSHGADEAADVDKINGNFQVLDNAATRYGAWYRNVGLAAPATSSTAIGLTSTDVQDEANNTFNLVSSGITIYRSGLYLINWYASLTSTANGYYSLFLSKSGATVAEAGGYIDSVNGSRPNASTLLRLATGDTLYMNVYMSAAGTIGGSSNPKDVGMRVTYLGF